MDQNSRSIHANGNAWLGRFGSLLMYVGAGCLFLLVISRSPDSTIRLPSFLYRNRDMWFVLAGGIVALGMVCVRRASVPRELTVTAGSPFNSVVLYTRKECHLCDVAKDILNKHRARLPGIDEIDIDEDEDLVAEFGECVPVVEIDGKVRFRGRIDEMLFKRLLDGGAQPTTASTEEPTASNNSETES